MAYIRPKTPAELAEQRVQLLEDRALWNAIHDLGAIHHSLENMAAIYSSLRDATLWWIGADCCDLLAQAAPSMPPVTLDPDAIPDADGFAFLERPISGQDAWHPELTITFDAIHWQPAIIRGLPCVSIIMWQHPTRPGPTPIPLGRTDWPIGFDTDHEPQDVPPQSLPSIIEDRQLLAALWQLSSQRDLVTTTEERPYRAAAKRIARKGHEPSPVRLVNLNPKQRRSSARAAAGTRHYTHRWVVKPHWRQQPYGPGRSLRRAQYIDQHVKGPSDKPVQVRDTVKFWTNP